MKVGIILPTLFSLLAFTDARSLSYRMRYSEKEACFYANVNSNVDLKNASLQFYFAVISIEHVAILM
jgi:hypothetical protein